MFSPANLCDSYEVMIIVESDTMLLDVERQVGEHSWYNVAIRKQPPANSGYILYMEYMYLYSIHQDTS